MPHTIAHKVRLLQRVRRIRGQLDVIERLLESEAGCAATLQQIAAARGAMNGLMNVVLEEHVRGRVVDGCRTTRAEAADELMAIVRSYLH